MKKATKILLAMAILLLIFAGIATLTQQENQYNMEK